MNSSTFNSRTLRVSAASITLGFAVTACALALLGNWIDTHRLDPMWTRRIPRTFWLKKAFPSPSFDVVIGGDSRTYSGLVPAVISGELGGAKVLNAGFPLVGFTPRYLDLLESALSPNGKRVIVMGVSPYSLLAKARTNRALNQYRNTPAIERWLALNAEQALKWIRPLKWTDVVFLILKRGPFDPGKKYDDDGTFELAHENGWIETWTTPTRFEYPDSVNFYTREFQADRVSREIWLNVLRRVRRWTSDSVVVAGLRIPTDESVALVEDELSGLDEAAFAREFEEAGGKWLFPDKGEYKSHDGSHLTADSARSLSRFVGQAISDPDGKPRQPQY